jgi:hypothetical protein
MERDRSRVGLVCREGLALLSIVALTTGCASSAYVRPRRIPVGIDGTARAPSPRSLHRPETALEDDAQSSPVRPPVGPHAAAVLVGRQFLSLLTPLALTLSMAAGAPSGNRPSC